MDRLQTVVAEVLQIEPAAVSDELGFNAAPNWDSIAHINMMLALEEAYELSISDEDLVELTTVRAIRAYVDRMTGALS